MFLVVVTIASLGPYLISAGIKFIWNLENQRLKIRLCSQNNSCTAAVFQGQVFPAIILVLFDLQQLNFSKERKKF